MNLGDFLPFSCFFHDRVFRAFESVIMFHMELGRCQFSDRVDVSSVIGFSTNDTVDACSLEKPGKIPTLDRSVHLLGCAFPLCRLGSSV